MSSSRDFLVKRLGPVFDRPDTTPSWFPLPQDLRRYLVLSGLGRDPLVVVHELLAGLDFDSGKTRKYFVICASRPLQEATGIDRRNVFRALATLESLGLIRVVDSGEAAKKKSAVYDLAPLFLKFEKWLDAGRPKTRRRKVSTKTKTTSPVDEAA